MFWFSRKMPVDIQKQQASYYIKMLLEPESFPKGRQLTSWSYLRLFWIGKSATNSPLSIFIIIIIIIIMHFISGSKAHKNTASEKTDTN